MLTGIGCPVALKLRATHPPTADLALGTGELHAQRSARSAVAVRKLTRADIDDT